MALREVLADLSVRVRGVQQLRAVNADVGRAVQSLGAMGRQLGNLGAAIGGVLAVRQLATWTRELIHMGDELDKTSQQIGMSVGELQRWRFAADRAGVDAQTMSQSIQRLARSAFEASRGGASQGESFRTLGIQVRAANGQLKSSDQLMREVTVALAGMEDRTAAAALAQRIMGRTGAQLMPLFNQGAEGVEALSRRFEELGGGLGEDMVAAAAAAQDALTDFGVATQSLKGRLAVSFLPTLTRAVSAIAEWGGSLSRVIGNTSTMQTILIGLGAALVAFFAANPHIVGAIALFGILLLLVEDLVTMFRGGRSAIGQFIDAMFGDGTAVQWVEDLTLAWQGFFLAMRQLYAFVRGQPIPTESGRVTSGVEQRQRDAAAAAGRLTRENGESREQSLKRTNRLRVLQGLRPLGPDGEEIAPEPPARRRGPRVPVAGLTPSTTVSGGALGAGRGGEGDQQVNVNASGMRIEINVPNGDADEIGARVGPEMEERLRVHVGRAVSRLAQGRRRGEGG